LGELLAPVPSSIPTKLLRRPIPLRGDPWSDPARDFTSVSPPISTSRRLLPWRLLCSYELIKCVCGYAGGSAVVVLPAVQR
jgi:hypothetical protein